jgi:hypothetical protein
MNKILFVRPPKTAGTSIYKALGMERNKDRRNFGHYDLKHMLKEGLLDKDFYDPAYKFTFVRNPYDRAVSLYFYMRVTKKLPGAIRSFHKFCRDILKSRVGPIGLYNNRNYSICNPQVRWAEGLEIDFVGRFEKLQEDFNTLCDIIGAPQKQLEFHRRIKRRHYSKMYCCVECLDTVNNIYREDFERFNYPILNGQ